MQTKTSIGTDLSFILENLQLNPTQLSTTTILYVIQGHKNSVVYCLSRVCMISQVIIFICHVALSVVMLHISPDAVLDLEPVFV